MDEAWLVLIGRIWHKVDSAEHRTTACDRSYGEDARVEHRAPVVGDVVCPACWDVERVGMH